MWDGLLHRLVQPFVSFGPLLPKVIVGLLVGIVLINIAIYVSRGLLRVGRVPRSLSDIILSLGAIVLWIMLLAELAKAVGLSSIAVTISGSLIVIGLALANGAGSMTSDIIAAFFIAKDKDFEIGYRIKTGDIEGIIDKIDVRKVRIVGDDGQRYVVPNTNLDKNGWVLLNTDKQENKEQRNKSVN